MLFEEHRGRFQASMYLNQKRTMTPTVGMCISYKRDSDKYGKMILEEVEIELVPLEQAKKDIHFFHYLLEFCVYFIPEGIGEPSIFMFFMTILKNYDQYAERLVQKKVLCKMLSHLGVYPYADHWNMQVQELLKTSIDSIYQDHLPMCDEHTLDQWLLWSIQSHPQGRWFKAIPFLLKSGA